MFSNVSNKEDIIEGTTLFITLNISVIKTCKFIWCIVILLHLDRRVPKLVSWLL